MIQKKRSLIVIPFVDFLEEFDYLNSLLWFYQGGVKHVVETLVESMGGLENEPMESLDLQGNFIDLWGKTYEDAVIEDFRQAVEILDRCNAAPASIADEEYLIQTFIGTCVQALEKKLIHQFPFESIWTPDYQTPLEWRFGRLIIPTMKLCTTPTITPKVLWNQSRRR